MSSCNKMAIDPASAALIAGALGSFKQSKIAKAEAGEKTYTKPKTIFGKLIGGVSGRTAAAEVSNMNKSNPVPEKVTSAMAPGQSRQIPVTGGISFGGEAVKRSYLPFYLGAIVLGIFFFMRKKGGRRRR